jgi:hypothetical protein
MTPRGRAVLAALLAAVAGLPHAAPLLCELVPTAEAHAPDANAHHSHQAASHQEDCRACVNGPTLVPAGAADSAQCALGACPVGTVATVPSRSRSLPLMPPAYPPVSFLTAGISGEPAAPPTPPPVS